MTAPTWLEEAEAAGVKPGRRLTFVLEYSGGGVDATVESMRDGIVFLSTGLRLRWAAVLGVRDGSPSANATIYDNVRPAPTGDWSH